jgi:Skp family chaperone for outer membrane proteins
MTNTMFPGRPDYVGPTTGLFGLLHHEVLCESSHDVMERVAYIKRFKPKNEVAIRVHNLICLQDCNAAAKRASLDADYEAKRDALDADYEAKRAALYADFEAKRVALYTDYQAKRAALYADYQAKRDALDAEILVYIKQRIPDCAWDGKTLVFAQ